MPQVFTSEELGLQPEAKGPAVFTSAQLGLDQEPTAQAPAVLTPQPEIDIGAPINIPPAPSALGAVGETLMSFPKGLGMAASLAGPPLKAAVADVAALAGAGQGGNLAAWSEGEQMPMQRPESPWVKSLPLRVAGSLVETAPKIVGMALGPKGLIGSSLTAAALFGTDEEGNFHPTEALIAAGIPGVMHLAKIGISKGILKAIPSAEIASNPVVQKATEFVGEQAALNAYMTATASPELMRLWRENPEEAKRQIADIVGVNLGFALLGIGNWRRRVPSHTERYLAANQKRYADLTDMLITRAAVGPEAQREIEATIKARMLHWTGDIGIGPRTTPPPLVDRTIEEAQNALLPPALRPQALPPALPRPAVPPRLPGNEPLLTPEQQDRVEARMRADDAARQQEKGPYAPPVRIEPPSGVQQYPGTPQRENVPPYPPEVRPEAGEQAGRGYSIERGGAVPPEAPPPEPQILTSESARSIDEFPPSQQELDALREKIMAGRPEGLTPREKEVLDWQKRQSENLRLLSPENAAKLSEKDFERWAYPRWTEEPISVSDAKDVFEILSALLMRGADRMNIRKVASILAYNVQRETDPAILRKMFERSGDPYTEEEIQKTAEANEEHNRATASYVEAGRAALAEKGKTPAPPPEPQIRGPKRPEDLTPEDGIPYLLNRLGNVERLVSFGPKADRDLFEKERQNILWELYSLDRLPETYVKQGNRWVQARPEPQIKAPESPGLMPESAKPIDWKVELQATIADMRRRIATREEVSGAIAQVRQPLVDEAFRKTIEAWDAVEKEPDPFKKVQLQSLARKADDDAVKFFSKEQKETVFRRMIDGEERVQAAWEKFNLDSVPENVRGIRMRPTDPEKRWFYLITPSTYPDQKGKWQATRIDERGPFGHFNADTPQDAVASLSGRTVKGIGPPWGSVGEWVVERAERIPKGGEAYAKEERVQGPQEVGPQPVLPPVEPGGKVLPSPEAVQPITVRTATGGEISQPRSTEGEKAPEMTVGEAPGQAVPRTASELAALIAVAKRVESRDRQLYEQIKFSGNPRAAAKARAAWRQTKLNVRELQRELKALKGPKGIDISKRMTADVGGERMPDIIDDILANVGTKLSLDSAKQYMEDIEERLKRGGAAAKLFTRKGGLAIDDALAMLIEANPNYRRLETEYDLLDAIFGAAEKRKGARKGEVREEQVLSDRERQTIDFEEAALRQRADTEGVKADTLLIGTKFKLRDVEFEVQDLIFDDNENLLFVVVEDGKRFGTQRVGADWYIFPDKGSLERKEAEVEFVSPEEAAAPEGPTPEWRRLFDEEKITGAQAKTLRAIEADTESIRQIPVGGETETYVRFKNGVIKWVTKTGELAETSRADEAFPSEEGATTPPVSVSRANLIWNAVAAYLESIRAIGAPSDAVIQGVMEITGLDRGEVEPALETLKYEGKIEWQKRLPQQINLIQRPPPAPAAEQPPVEGVPERGPAPPVAPPSPPKPAGPALDLFGQPIAPEKPAAPEPPKGPQEIQGGLEIGTVPSGEPAVKERPLTAAEKKEFRALSLKLRANREEGGEALTTEEAQRYEYLGALAGQKTLGIDVQVGLKGKLKALVAQLASLDQRKPQSRGKRYDKWALDRSDIERQIKKIRSQLTEGQGEDLGTSGPPEEMPNGMFMQRRRRVRQMTDEEVRERWPDPGERLDVFRLYGERPWVAESRTMEFSDAFGTQLEETGDWYIAAWGKSRDEAITEAQRQKRKGWENLPEKKPEPPPAIWAKELWQLTRKELGDNRELLRPKLGVVSDTMHRDAVAQAIRDGKPVPPEVLADFPELAPKPEAPPPAPAAPAKPEFAGGAPEGARVGNYLKKDGRWYRVDAEGNLGKIPTNKKQHDQLEQEFASPTPADTRTPIEILAQAKRVSVKLPEGATVLRGYDAKGRKSDIFIANINKGDNIFRDAGIVRVEAGFINKDKQFKPIKGDIKVSERKPAREGMLPETERQALPEKPPGAPIQMSGNDGFLIPPLETGPREGLPAFHGTPHEVDRFQLKYLGTGEGAQVFGWGLYFAEAREVAERYKQSLSGGEPRSSYRFNGREAWEWQRDFEKAMEYDKASVWERIQLHHPKNAIRVAARAIITDDAESAAKLLKYIETLPDSLFAKERGNIYTVDIAEDSILLDWDRPLREQPQAVRAALARLEEQGDPQGTLHALKAVLAEHLTGSDFYRRLEALRGAKWASEALQSVGINGIRYLDQKSRDFIVQHRPSDGKWYVLSGKPSPGFATEREARDWGYEQSSRNYVIWDESKIRITEKNGKPVSLDEFRQAMPPREGEAVPSRDVILAQADSPEQLLAHVDRPELQIPAEMKALVKALLSHPVAKKIQGLRWAIADVLAGGFEGDFDPHGRLARFSRWAEVKAPVHEFLHDLWYFLQPGERGEFMAMRVEEIRKALKDLPRNAAEIAALEKLLEAPVTSEEFLALKMPRSLYWLANEREFFVSAMQEPLVKRLTTPEAQGAIAKVREYIKGLWDAFKDWTKLSPKTERLFRQIFEGKYEFTPEQGAAAEAREGALPTSPEEFRKQKRLLEPNVAGRTLAGFAEPAKMKMELADQFNLSPRARRMIRLPREAEMYSIAAGELTGIENYVQARDAVPKDNPHLRWGVTHDAITGIDFQEHLGRTLTATYERQLAKVDSPAFQQKIFREAQLALRSDLAAEKEETFRNIIAGKAAALEAQIRNAAGDDARIETLREDLRLTRPLMDWAMAVSQQMDNIVNRVYREYTEFGRAGYWTRWRENATGPKNAEEFFRLYQRARAAEGNPLVERQEVALARLASEILGINFGLADRLLWAERWRREPDFAKAVNELGEKFVKDLRTDPAKAIRGMITREGTLATRAWQAKTAYLAINRDVMRELELLGDLEQAATVMKRLRDSDQWKQLVNTVITDAEGEGVPAVVVDAMRAGKYSSAFNEGTGKQVWVDPKGGFHEVDLNWTPDKAVEAQKKIDGFLTAVNDWIYDDANANSPELAYWRQQADWVRAVYKTASVFAPSAVKSLFVQHSLTMLSPFFRQAKLPAVKVLQDMAENYERAQNIGKQWSVGFDQDNMDKARRAAEAHGFHPISELPLYRSNIFDSLAWHYRHGIAIKPGQKLYGVTVLKEDIDLLKHQGGGLFNLIKRALPIGRKGREAKMQEARLVDQYLKTAFLMRPPQEFGAEPGTTVMRDFSTRGGGFADAVGKNAIDVKQEVKGGKTVETREVNLDKFMQLANLPQYFEPVVWRWISERSRQYNDDTGFEPLLNKLRDRIHEGTNPPRSVEDVLDYITRNSEASPEEVKKAIVGNMAKETFSYYRNFIEKPSGRSLTVRALRATSQGPFNTAFDHDIGSSFFYDYGMFSTQEVRAAAVDATMFYLERVEAAMRSTLDVYDEALRQFRETRSGSPERKALMQQNRALFRSGDDFRDYSALRGQRDELQWFMENLPIWSKQNISRNEGLNTLYRVIGDSVVSKLAGWKTVSRVFTGSAVKQGFVFSAIDRLYGTSYLKSALSMALSAYDIALKGPAMYLARRAGLAEKRKEKFSGVAEEIFREGKFFDPLYDLGMGTKTPLLNTIKNNLAMPYTHGRGYDPKFSTNAGIALLQKGAYRLLSGAETPLEVLRTIFPTLGYSVAYDSVARQAFNAISVIERQARRSFELHEEAGTLGRFDLNDPRNPKNVLPASDILPRGLFPKTQTQLAQARELFKRGTDGDLNDFVMEFWAKLARTPKDQRGEVHLLSADAKTPEEAARLQTNRSLGIAAIGLLDIHHAGFTNRMWVMRGSSMWRLMQPIAGWTFQSTRQLFELFGKSATDPALRPAVATALTAIMVLAGLAAMGIGGDLEKRLFDELEWIINKRVDPVRYFGMGRDWKENTIIALTGIFTYITVLSGYLERLMSEKGNRTSVTDQMFVLSLANSMVRYVSGVIHTKDPNYGLAGFVTREIPSLKPLIRRTSANEGLTNVENAITAIQRFAPKDLIRQTTGGFGMPTPTELSVPKNKLKNAIYAGDSEGVIKYFAELRNKAVELKRTEPLRLAADIMRSLNPYTLALIGHPTEVQRQELLGRLSDRERQVILDAETNYLAAAQLVGVQSRMTRQPPGGGGEAVSAAPAFGGGYAVGGGGGAGLRGITTGYGGAGGFPSVRRISLGRAGGVPTAFRRISTRRGPTTRLRLGGRIGRPRRYTTGRIKLRPRRLGMRLRQRVTLPRTRRLTLRV